MSTWSSGFHGLGHHLPRERVACATRLAVGDRVIICAYASMSDAEIATHKPSLVYLDANNNIVRTSKDVPVQVA